MNEIPVLIAFNEFKDIPIVECGEPLVELEESKKLKIENIYYRRKIKGSTKSVFVRATVARMLRTASEKLTDKNLLLVKDGWRPQELQLSLYHQIFSEIRRSNPGLSEYQLHEETSKYCSNGLDNNCPSSHITGGAVDVSLCDADYQEVVMGNSFDDPSIISSTRFFEQRIEEGTILNYEQQKALLNRRLLYFCMTNSGFTNYAREWWHYDYGNQLWGKTTGRIAKYGAVNKLTN